MESLFLIVKWPLIIAIFIGMNWLLYTLRERADSRFTRRIWLASALWANLFLIIAICTTLPQPMKHGINNYVQYISSLPPCSIANPCSPLRLYVTHKARGLVTFIALGFGFWIFHYFSPGNQNTWSMGGITLMSYRDSFLKRLCVSFVAFAIPIAITAFYLYFLQSLRIAQAS